MLIELRQALISYQYYYMLLLNLAGHEATADDEASSAGLGLGLGRRKTDDENGGSAVATESPLVVQCPDTADCTKAVQAALDHPTAAHVLIPATGATPWQVEPLFIHRGNLGC